MRGVGFGAVVALAVVMALAATLRAQQAPVTLGVLEFHFTPTKYAQLALWIERADGQFVSTVRLTEAVAVRGIGNRPGASQMNSGFRWPYGRREGALPVWALRRSEAPGARLWQRVIFQDRTFEGLASRTSNDQSPDDYYCLSFDKSRSTKTALEAARDALDAISCASVFSSDKGRFMTDDDVARGYAEPYEAGGVSQMRAMPKTSLYPPRRDVKACPSNNNNNSCYDHPDSLKLAAHAREVMPEIDAVTMATPVGGVAQRILYTVPADWNPGDYRACLEINVEGDYNSVWNDQSYPTPQNPDPSVTRETWWDSWALTYGYPYRGQPSVVYCTDFRIGGSEAQSFTSAVPAGSSGSWAYEDPTYGEMRSMDGMSDDPVSSPGSGADRLQLMEDGYRMKVVVKPPLSCREDAPPSAVSDVKLGKHRGSELDAHRFASLSFRAASDDHGVFRYEVRVSTDPITDEASFMAAMPAKQATLEAAELLVPVETQPGEMIEVGIGGLVAETHYYVGVRAMDGCTGVGPIQIGEFTTPKRVFSTVTPCFVATAAYGSPLAGEVSALRRVRDRYLMTNEVGRALVSAYYAAGPALSDAIREREGLRAAARSVLSPVVEFARWLDRP